MLFPLQVFFSRKAVSIGSVPACLQAGQSNTRLTCICVFAEAKRRQSWRESCIKKGAAPAATASSNFRDKTNVSVEARVRHAFFIYISYLTLISYTIFLLIAIHS